MKLRLTYANKMARMKTETVIIDLKNLTPACIALGYTSAKFNHRIEKIRDVLDFPAGDDVYNGNCKLEDTLNKIDMSDLADYNQPHLTEIYQDIKAQADREIALGSNINNIDTDFIDKYTLYAAQYKNQIDTTPPDDTTILVESKLELEKTQDNIAIFHLNVSLATFSLNVPYMNQNVGAVKLTRLDKSNARVDSKDVKVNIIGEPVANPAEYQATWDIWSGDALCAPTTAVMILDYYRIPLKSTIESVYLTEINENIGEHESLRARLMAKIYNKEINKASNNDIYLKYNPWENRFFIKEAIEEIFKSYDKHGKFFQASNSTIFKSNDASSFIDQMKKLLPVLKEGYPVYTGIRGLHILAVRDAVISNDGLKIWAICNDPYGTLAGASADYTKEASGYWWYAEEEFGKRESRQERNTPGEEDTRGKHVYYNDKTHSRINETEFALFKFNHAHNIFYKNTVDAAKTGRQYVEERLVHGENQ